ncbi:hypothetical protein D3C71_1342490 [compost metagenome]
MQRQRQALYAMPVFLAQFHAGDLGADLPLHLVDVAAGRKCLARRGQDQHAHGRVALDAREHGQHLVHDVAAGQGIAGGRVVQRQRGHAVRVQLEMHEFRHVVLLTLKFLDRLRAQRRKPSA